MRRHTSAVKSTKESKGTRAVHPEDHVLPREEEMLCLPLNRMQAKEPAYRGQTGTRGRMYSLLFNGPRPSCSEYWPWWTRGLNALCYRTRPRGLHRWLCGEKYLGESYTIAPWNRAIGP